MTNTRKYQYLSTQELNELLSEAKYKAQKYDASGCEFLASVHTVETWEIEDELQIRSQSK